MAQAEGSRICFYYEIYISETNILTRRQEALRLPTGGRQPPRRKEPHMSARLTVRHKVHDYAAWRKVYDELGPPLRTQHGCTAQRVMQVPGDANDLFVTHD